jgi:hypothetical protein
MAEIEVPSRRTSLAAACSGPKSPGQWLDTAGGGGKAGTAECGFGWRNAGPTFADAWRRRATLLIATPCAASPAAARHLREAEGGVPVGELSLARP